MENMKELCDTILPNLKIAIFIGFTWRIPQTANILDYTYCLSHGNKALSPKHHNLKESYKTRGNCWLLSRFAWIFFFFLFTQKTNIKYWKDRQGITLQWPRWSLLISTPWSKWFHRYSTMKWVFRTEQRKLWAPGDSREHHKLLRSGHSTYHFILMNPISTAISTKA